MRKIGGKKEALGEFVGRRLRENDGKGRSKLLEEGVFFPCLVLKLLNYPSSFNNSRIRSVCTFL